MIEFIRELRARGLRAALLTNNVREWEPLWRAKLPEVDELFEVVVDSAFVGLRKPDPEIYALTLERLGGVSPEDCVFVDDLDAELRGGAGARHGRGALRERRAGDPGDRVSAEGLGARPAWCASPHGSGPRSGADAARSPSQAVHADAATSAASTTPRSLCPTAVELGAEHPLDLAGLLPARVL